MSAAAAMHAVESAMYSTPDTPAGDYGLSQLHPPFACRPSDTGSPSGSYSDLNVSAGVDSNRPGCISLIQPQFGAGSYCQAYMLFQLQVGNWIV